MPTRAQGPVGLAQQHTPRFAPFQPLEVSTATLETSQIPRGLSQQRKGLAPFQPPPISRHSNPAAFSNVPRTGSHSPRRQPLEALGPPTASCSSSPARTPAAGACFRGAQNPCGGSSPAFSPRTPALETGGGIVMCPPALLPVGSSRLSFTGAPQPYYVPALLQSARSSAAEMFHFPRSPSTESDDLYPDSPQTDRHVRQMAAPSMPLRHSEGFPYHAPGHASHHRRSRSSMSDELANSNPAGYHLSSELQQQPCEYTHCLTWQGGPRRDSNEGTGPSGNHHVTSHDVPVVATTGGNVRVASVSATSSGLASDKRGSGRLCRSVQDDDVAEGAAPCQRGKPSAEGSATERAASSHSVRKDGTLGRTNGRNGSGDSQENSTGLGGVGRIVAGSGRRSSGRLSRNLGDDENEDQRSGKSGSGRLQRSLENDDVAADDMSPRQLGTAGLSTARRNPSSRHAKGGSEGDGKQPDRATRTQPNSTQAGKSASQGKGKPKSQFQRSLEEDDCEHRSRSPRVSTSGSDRRPSASEPRERSSSPSIGSPSSNRPAGSPTRSGGSILRAAGAAAGKGDGTSIRQGSRLSRSMERDGVVGRAGGDSVSSRQSSRLGRGVEKEGVAAQKGSASECGGVGRRGVRGGEKGGEQGQSGEGQVRRQPVKLCRSLDDDDRKDGVTAGGNGVSSSWRRIRRSIDDDYNEDKCAIGALGAGQKPRTSLQRHLSDDDSDDDEKVRAVGGKGGGGGRRHDIASKDVEIQDSGGAEKNMHKPSGLLHKMFTFQRD